MNNPALLAAAFAPALAFTSCTVFERAPATTATVHTQKPASVPAPTATTTTTGTRY